MIILSFKKLGDSTQAGPARGCSGKETTCDAGDTRDASSIPGSGRLPWRRKRQPTSVFLPGESHGQGSLVGFGPWGHRVRHDYAHTHACTSRPECTYNHT